MERDAMERAAAFRAAGHADVRVAMKRATARVAAVPAVVSVERGDERLMRKNEELKHRLRVCENDVTSHVGTIQTLNSRLAELDDKNTSLAYENSKLLLMVDMYMGRINVLTAENEKISKRAMKNLSIMLELVGKLVK